MGHCKCHVGGSGCPVFGFSWLTNLPRGICLAKGPRDLHLGHQLEGDLVETLGDNFMQND